MATTNPSDWYRARRSQQEAAVRALDAASARFSWIRFTLGVAAAALLWGVIGPRAIPWPWLLAPIAAFLAVARLHELTLRRRTRTERAARYAAAGLARLSGTWAGAGDTGGYADPAHPYAADLDLFGRGSLFDLISRARTRAGAELLAEWLCAPATLPDIRTRQAAVAELRDRWELREDLAVLGADVGGQVHTKALAAWGAAAPRIPRRALVAGASAALGLGNVVFLATWLGGVIGVAPFALCAAASIVLTLAVGRAAREVLHSIESPADELSLLSETIARLGRERFETERLRELLAALVDGGGGAAPRIAQLARRSEWNDSRHNPLFAPLSALMLFGIQLACSVERWRRESGPRIGTWLDALAELEALASLACHSAENPGDPFPEVVEGGPLVAAEGLAHPLLPVVDAVRNDVSLGREPALWIVSGSNMSGKSTLLRSVGLNTVLALAGGTVRARSFRVSLVQVGACMRVADSIQSGTSHFYAEILRLKLLVDLGARGRPLLFLLDEILHGTNSHDRRIGAEALARGLLAQGAIGLITTHDLALARIADELSPRAANVHFVDHLEHGRMVFDYRIRPGVVERSNALALMRAVGLDVSSGEF